MSSSYKDISGGKIMARGISCAVSVYLKSSYTKSKINIRYHCGGSMELNARILLLAYIVYL
jgi:hypothetical protein